MYADRDEFEGWMVRIMERFDITEKLLERVLKKNSTLDGDELLDNQDLCLLLKVGIRTLQRYRAIGVLPYFTISGKVFYRAKDVHEFISNRLEAVTVFLASIFIIFTWKAPSGREIGRGYCFVIRQVCLYLQYDCTNSSIRCCCRFLKNR